jgi:hypothetical protein
MRPTPFIPAKAGIQGPWSVALGPRNGSPRRERRGVPLAGTNGHLSRGAQSPISIALEDWLLLGGKGVERAREILRLHA